MDKNSQQHSNFTFNHRFNQGIEIENVMYDTKSISCPSFKLPFEHTEKSYSSY